MVSLSIEHESGLGNKLRLALASDGVVWPKHKIAADIERDQSQWRRPTTTRIECHPRLAPTMLTQRPLVRENNFFPLKKVPTKASGDLSSSRPSAASVGQLSVDLNGSSWQNQSNIVNVIKRRNYARHLLIGACLLASALFSLDRVSSYSLAKSTGSTRKLATAIKEPDLSHLDESCDPNKTKSLSEAGQLLLMLKCDIKPLFKLFEQTYGNEAVQEIGLANDHNVGDELVKMSESIEAFADQGLEIIGFLNFCNIEMVNKLRKLKTLARDSKLLMDTFNLIAIEYHGSCLRRIIPTLPPVPQLVREVVQTYIDGADKPFHFPDSPRPFEGYQDHDFNVDAAIKRSGSLSTVVGLSLTIGATADMSKFLNECKSLVQQIDTSWTVLSTMDKMLDTGDNNILWVNNAVLRSLPTTRFADICSKLSARA